MTLTPFPVRSALSGSRRNAVRSTTTSSRRRARRTRHIHTRTLTPSHMYIRAQWESYRQTHSPPAFQSHIQYHNHRLHQRLESGWTPRYSGGNRAITTVCTEGLSGEQELGEGPGAQATANAVKRERRGMFECRESGAEKRTKEVEGIGELERGERGGKGQKDGLAYVLGIESTCDETAAAVVR